MASAGRLITCGAVLARTYVGTVHAKFVERALVEAFVAHESGFADALA